MATSTRIRDVPAESETAAHLREADKSPVIFVVDGARYRVVREPAASSEDATRGAYDPQRAIDGMRAAAGAISEEDAERWITDIYRWRREGSRAQEPST